MALLITRRFAFGAGLAAVALVAVVALTGRAPSNSPTAATSPTEAEQKFAVEQAQRPSAVRRPLALGGAPDSLRPKANVSALPLGSNIVPQLDVDAQGHLVVNAHTRNELERLIALNDRAAASALLQQLAITLPPTAYRQATDAYYAFQNYEIAAAQAFPPSQPVLDEAAAARQLDALHALRVANFGADTAQAYFGDEEATARRLLSVMQSQPAGTSTFEQRAEQAQQPASATKR